jgi:hypothetical protein
MGGVLGLAVVISCSVVLRRHVVGGAMSISRGARIVARFVRYGLAAPTAAGARCTRRVGCAI